MKSTKTYADNSNSLYKLIKGNIDNTYFLEVLYYYIRLALIQKGFNLYDVSFFNISGKYLGYDIKVILNRFYDNVLKSLSLALSLRAFIINKDYFKYAFDDELLFYSINSNYLNWNCHRVIMECMCDEDFSFIYKIIINYLDEKTIPDEFIDDFEDRTIQPEYQHHEEFCKILAGRDDYHGKTVIKNNQFLYSDIENFVIDDVVEYVGNTVFSYCENLKELEFKGKVIFGYFPIIECNNLKRIIVPSEFLDYYKEKLPYYRDIICDYEHKDEVLELEEGIHDDIKDEVVDDYDDLEIEHVYLDSNSAAAYMEKEEPQELQIDYCKLDEIFEKKATSYKYFWFLSIISLANERKQLKIQYKDIVIRMAAMAWPMIFEDEINLGKIDMMTKYLSSVEKSTKLIPAATSKVVENYLTQHYQSQGVDRILSPLLKNVPYRFLSPWVKYTTDEDVVTVSNRRDFTGLYALEEEGIALNETWWNYIKENYREICKQTMESFETYLKDYNSGMALVKLKFSGIPFIG